MSTIGVTPIPELDQRSGFTPMHLQDALAAKELAWVYAFRRGRNIESLARFKLLNRSLTLSMGLMPLVFEVFRKLVSGTIGTRSDDGSQRVLEIPGGPRVVVDLPKLRPNADGFARLSIEHQLVYEALVDVARSRGGADKLRILRHGAEDFANWPTTFPSTELVEAYFPPVNDLMGTIVDLMIIDDLLAGLQFADVQRQGAKRYPWMFCVDCGQRDGCTCAEANQRARTGQMVVDMNSFEPDPYQSVGMTYWGLQLQMIDQYHSKNMARGWAYTFHRIVMETVEYYQGILTRKLYSSSGLVSEASDRRIWLAVMANIWGVNLAGFVAERYEAMRRQREAQQVNMASSPYVQGPVVAFDYDPRILRWYKTPVREERQPCDHTARDLPPYPPILTDRR